MTNENEAYANKLKKILKLSSEPEVVIGSRW